MPICLSFIYPFYSFLWCSFYFATYFYRHDSLFHPLCIQTNFHIYNSQLLQVIFLLLINMVVTVTFFLKLTGWSWRQGPRHNSPFGQRRIISRYSLFIFYFFFYFYFHFWLYVWTVNEKTRIKIIWKKDLEYNSINLLSQKLVLCGHLVLHMCLSPTKITGFLYFLFKVKQKRHESTQLNIEELEWVICWRTLC